MSKFSANNSQKLMQKRDLSYIGQVSIIDNKTKKDDKKLFCVTKSINPRSNFRIRVLLQNASEEINISEK